MAAPEYNVFEGDGLTVGPSRPALADFGGASKENAVEMPDPVTMPDARDHNQMAWVLAALSAVATAAIIEVRHTSGLGVAYIHGVWSLNSAVTAASFTVSHLGDGSVQISWTAGTFPAGSRPHGFTSNSKTHAAIGRVWHTAASTIRIYTETLAGTAVDVPFTFCIGGETD